MFPGPPCIINNHDISLSCFGRRVTSGASIEVESSCSNLYGSCTGEVKWDLSETVNRYSYIRATGLRWFGHVTRMPDTKFLLNWTPQVGNEHWVTPGRST